MRDKPGCHRGRDPWVELRGWVVAHATSTHSSPFMHFDSHSGLLCACARDACAMCLPFFVLMVVSSLHHDLHSLPSPCFIFFASPCLRLGLLPLPFTLLTNTSTYRAYHNPAQRQQHRSRPCAGFLCLCLLPSFLAFFPLLGDGTAFVLAASRFLFSSRELRPSSLPFPSRSRSRPRCVVGVLTMRAWFWFYFDFLPSFPAEFSFLFCFVGRGWTDVEAKVLDSAYRLPARSALRTTLKQWAGNIQRCGVHFLPGPTWGCGWALVG
ncbi:hypothetical protein B0H16DRAFT_201831 [Mycena metata]|uniref:Uncharacterized protein n=1 Tax=Mycena metata TaxID=1033252 RepID=A0AAD7MTS5_9AGAR|nr:hypothetical protein B0H16DRAFT_201831 [Mycena metata]